MHNTCGVFTRAWISWISFQPVLLFTTRCHWNPRNSHNCTYPGQASLVLADNYRGRAFVDSDKTQLLRTCRKRPHNPSVILTGDPVRLLLGSASERRAAHDADDATGHAGATRLVLREHRQVPVARLAPRHALLRVGATVHRAAGVGNTRRHARLLRKCSWVSARLDSFRLESHPLRYES